MKIKLFLIASIIVYSCNICYADHNDWTRFDGNGNFYKIFNTTRLNFAQSIEFCANKSSVLASISSEEEFKWLQTFIPQYSGNNIVWVKYLLYILLNRDIYKYFQVGGKSNTGYNFTWLADGNAVSRSSSWWCSGFSDPDFYNSAEYCTNFLPVEQSNGSSNACLNDNDCFMNFYPLCSVIKNAKSTKETTALKNVAFFSGK